MISIRELDYDTHEKPEQVFSRLTWAVERVDRLTGSLFNGVTVDTNRPWVGVYDKGKMTFRLIQPSGYFISRKLFQVVVRGIVMDEGSKTKINIKLRLGWGNLYFFSCMYLGGVCMIALTVMHGELKDFWGVLLWILVFPVFGTILLNRKLNRIESKVEDLFGIV